MRIEKGLLIADGLKRFKAFLEPETNTILVRVRRDVKIVDGIMRGSEIDVYDGGTFRIWTHKTQKSRALAEQHRLKVVFGDGECELYVPLPLANAVLPVYGAIFKRTVNVRHLVKYHFQPHVKSL